MNQTNKPILSRLVTLAEVWDALRQANIAKVEVAFSGGGDSGSINDVTAMTHTGEFDNLMTRALPVPDPDGQTRTAKTLRSFIEDECDRLLSHDDVPDWYNNEGGEGEFTFYVGADNASSRVELQVRVRIVEFDNHDFTFDWKLDEGGLVPDGSEDADTEAHHEAMIAKYGR